VITGLIDTLPDQVRCEQDAWIEQFLVEQAQLLDVDALRRVARRVEATVDPDGLLKDVEYRRRRRDLRLTVRPDGSSHGEFEGTAEFTEWLRTVLDVLARPRPEANGVKDPRTAGQRRHDGLLEGFKLMARANQLPRCAGVTTTVLLTMTDHAYATGEGTATTAHGVLLHAKEAQIPHWIPPKWRDQDQVPIRNQAHDPTEPTRLSRRQSGRGIGLDPGWVASRYGIQRAEILGGQVNVQGAEDVCELVRTADLHETCFALSNHRMGSSAILSTPSARPSIMA
jgi:hypothetical protein